jgi:hypothetical protein
MDLGNGNFYHIAGLVIDRTYTQSITLNSDLYVDVLNMQGGTISGAKNLIITQQNSDQTKPVATNFGTSYFFNGKINVNTSTQGDGNHQVTLVLSGAGNNPAPNPDLEANLTTDAFTTMQWRAGSMTVGAGKTITINGSFLADSLGTIGGAGKWNLTVNRGGTLSKGKGTFQNVTETINAGGKMFKVASTLQDGSADIFVVIGTVSQDGGSTEVQSGTLSVQGDVSQDSGSILVDAGQTLDISGDLSDSGDNVTVACGATLDVSGAIDESGGTLDMQGSTVEADAGLTIESGAELSGSGTIIEDPINSGVVQVGGTNTIGTIVLTGDYTQNSSGQLNLAVGEDDTGTSGRVPPGSRPRHQSGRDEHQSPVLANAA